MKLIVLSAIKKENLILLLFMNSCPRALQKRAVVAGRHQKKEVDLLLESEDVLQAVAIQPEDICNFAVGNIHVDDLILSIYQGRHPCAAARCQPTQEVERSCLGS